MMEGGRGKDRREGVAEGGGQEKPRRREGRGEDGGWKTREKGEKEKRNFAPMVISKSRHLWFQRFILGIGLTWINSRKKWVGCLNKK